MNLRRVWKPRPSVAAPEPKGPAAGDYLPQAALLRLLAVLALVIAPHLLRMPLWLGLSAVAIGAWRAAATLRQWPLPPKWLKVFLVLLAFAGVQVSFGRVNGQHAGAALLVIMLALKLTEMRSRRDVLVVVSLCYFTMITHFLFSQELWTVLYLLGCSIAVTALLVEANHPGGALPRRVVLGFGARLVAQALPLMLLLFVLFPRVPGPLWGLPADAGAARSGIADSMAPGEISRLIQSEEIAFRVRFSGAVPPMSQRYWRGPVLDFFDGHAWRAPFAADSYFRAAAASNRKYDNAFRPPTLETTGEPVGYEMTLEPHRQLWLFALDMPAAESLPPEAALTGYQQMLSRELVKETFRYDGVAWPHYRLQNDLDPEWQDRNRLLPRNRNPRAFALAQRWRDEGLSPEQLIGRALTMYREQDFHYTLEPPELGDDMVDEFLFDTKRGFCEHYAGSFTALMRAAGLPARVVVGYLGGEQNAVGDYYVVRQSDAHAWSEVWIAGRGWVRVDPTAAVAPSRVERGISAALAPSELPGYLRREGSGFWYWRLQADVAWDWVNVQWDRWVLAFNPQRQLDLLSRIGLGDWQNMVIALTVGITLVMGVLGALGLRRLRPPADDDAALARWREALRLLAKHGLAPRPGEGPRDFVARAARERPELAAPLEPLLRSYLEARYLGADPAGSLRALGDAVAALAGLKAARGSPTGRGTAA